MEVFPSTIITEVIARRELLSITLINWAHFTPINSWSFTRSCSFTHLTLAHSFEYNAHSLAYLQQSTPAPLGKILVFSRLWPPFTLFTRFESPSPPYFSYFLSLLKIKIFYFWFVCSLEYGLTKLPRHCTLMWLRHSLSHSVCENVILFFNLIFTLIFYIFLCFT